MSASYFRRLARYNRWANRRLYEACAKLDDNAYRQPRPSFFGSIHQTLNHILVADRIWLGRIVGEPSGLDRLDAEIYADFAKLCAAREEEDARIIGLCGKIITADLDGWLDYVNMAGAPQRTELRVVWGHVFNHQTHHRGQVHGMLSQTGIDPPPLDLIYFSRDPEFTLDQPAG